MNWKDFRKSKWFSVAAIFSSIYVIVLTGFVVWMVFFDTNSFLIHRELNQEIEKLEKKREFLKVEIEKDKKIILSSDLELPTEELMQIGIKKVGSSHPTYVLRKNKKGEITTQSMKLLYYYHNKLSSYGLDEYI